MSSVQLDASSYKEFLRAMGKGAGMFFRGTAMFLPDLNKGLKTAARELLEENQQPTQVLDDAFVFSMHQGYQFDYFYTTDGDDPPVYHYMEGEGAPQLRWTSLSVYLRGAIAWHASLA